MRPAGSVSTLESSGAYLFYHMKKSTTLRTIPTHKTCIACSVTKNKDQFVRHGGHKDGLQTKCRSCTNEANKNRRAAKARQKDSQNVPDVPPTQSITAPPKNVAKSILEAPKLIVSLPGIYEVENRGKGYTSFRFENPVDGSTFAFESFAEARKARKCMVAIFEQQSKFDGVKRQSTGKPAAEIFDESV